MFRPEIVTLGICSVFSINSLTAKESWEKADKNQNLPNVVLIFCDDLGYGDLSCYGATLYKTPVLDRMASEGMRFTNFYCAQAVCSASRAGLMTGCYPNRVGIGGALFPHSTTGLNPEEETIPEVLKGKGYRSAIFGKWHLGYQHEFLPLQQGFGEFFGLPYSNDMFRYNINFIKIDPGYPDLCLMQRNEKVREIISQDDQDQLTTLFTDKAVDFINRNKDNPFFVYLAHSMPHVPLGVSSKFRGKSEQGLYGDVMMELDWSVGQVLDALEKNDLSDNTLVIFTSDNGPWLNYGNHAGSAGGLREGKNTTWEGGQRVPCIMYWPGVIPEGTICNRMASTIDILPTLTNLTDAPLPARKIDGVSILTLLKGEDTANPREIFLYYFRDDCLQAVRKNQWKLVFSHESSSYGVFPPGRDGKFGQIGSARVEMGLFDMWRDPGERYNMKDSFPEVVAELEKIAEEAREDLGDGLTHRKGKNLRPPGRVTDEKNNRPPGCKSE